MPSRRRRGCPSSHRRRPPRRTRQVLWGGMALLSLAATGLLLLHYGSDPVSLADLLAGRFDAAMSYACLILLILGAWFYLAWAFFQTTRLYTGAARVAVGTL